LDQIDFISDSLVCQTIFLEETEHMSVLQRERLRVLCQEIEPCEDYASKIAILKEAHFPTKRRPLNHQTLAENAEGLDDRQSNNSKEMASYISAARKLVKGH